MNRLKETLTAFAVAGVSFQVATDEITSDEPIVNITYPPSVMVRVGDHSEFTLKQIYPHMCECKVQIVK